MKHKVKVEAVLAELKDNIANDGLPPTEDFTELCEYVTNWMLRRYDLERDSDINWGYCFIWAYLVWALWPEELTFKTVTGHVVVVKDNLYFDSEHPCGEANLKKFCSFEYRDDAKHVDVRTMCWYWARAGKRLDKFRTLIRKFTPSLYNSVRDNGSHYWKTAYMDFRGYDAIGRLPEIKA